MHNPGKRLSPTTLATILVLLGLLLAAGSSVVMFFARFFAESGPGLGFMERAMIATPMIIAIALLVAGGMHGTRAQERAGGPGGDGWRALFIGGVMIGVLAGLVTVGFLFG